MPVGGRMRGTFIGNMLNTSRIKSAKIFNRLEYKVFSVSFA